MGPCGSKNRLAAVLPSMTGGGVASTGCAGLRGPCKRKIAARPHPASAAQGWHARLAARLRFNFPCLECAAMMATIAAYRTVAMDLPRSLEQIAADPVNARQSKDYLARISDVKSVDDFMRDDRVLTYALKAHGLEEMTYAKAFIRKVLEEGIDGEGAFANKLADSRYRDLAETFNFARHGAATTVFTRAQAGTVEKFNRQALEVQAGADNEGVRLALYFERRAPKIDNTYDILADPALARVARTLAGLPESIGAIDVDKQAAMIEWRIDISEFRQPEKLSRLIERFTALWDVESGGSAIGSTADELSLFNAPALIGPDGDTLLALQGWRGALG
jgi:hypothetical protein